MPILDVRHVKKQFTQREILKDVNLQLASGETAIISGDNGCGKTTLLRIMATLSQPSHGDVELNIDRRELGVLIQPMHVIPHFTVGELLRFYADLHASSNDLTTLTELFGLADYLSMPCMQLSRGFRQRLALTVALAFRPKLLILDEPFESLDERASTTLIKQLQQQQTQGVALVLVAHQRELRQAVSKSEYHLSDGQLVRQ